MPQICAMIDFVAALTIFKHFLIMQWAKTAEKSLKISFVQGKETVHTNVCVSTTDLYVYPTYPHFHLC